MSSIEYGKAVQKTIIFNQENRLTEGDLERIAKDAGLPSLPNMNLSIVQRLQYSLVSAEQIRDYNTNIETYAREQHARGFITPNNWKRIEAELFAASIVDPAKKTRFLRRLEATRYLNKKELNYLEVMRKKDPTSDHLTS